MQSLSQLQRCERGRQICDLGNQVRRLDENTYAVKSQSGNGEYQVRATEAGWLCTCPDSTLRGEKCKHTFAVEFSKRIRTEVELGVLAPFNTTDACLYCGSKHIVKDGQRHNKVGSIQKFNCLECRRYFTVNLGFEGMKHSPKAITTAMQLYFSGESLRNTQKALRLLGVNVSHVAVLKWIKKYVGLMDKYLDKITPQVSDTWRADEVFVKFRGNMKYLFAMMDDETRFWIAQQVADGKFTADVRPLFAESKRVAGKKPATLITDGGMHFTKPFKQEFYTAKYPRTQHVRDIRISGVVHNNKMERLNGEFRDREKVMRGLKRTDSPILKGYQIYHNFIRPHEGLNGDTPADRAGIRVRGENKWVTLIQNATRETGKSSSAE
jgi:transposase-like protein